MNDTKHTPAPWAMSRSATPEHTPQYIVYPESSGRTVAIVMGENAHSDAALITAAPKLLSAAEAVVAAWEQGNLAAAVRELSAAITEAKGT